MNEKTRILVKQKNIQIVLDYCLQQKTEFSVFPKVGKNEEWEIELTVKSISKAIELGIFINANKLEIINNQFLNNPTPATIVTKAKSKKKEKVSPVSNQLNEIEDIEKELKEISDKKEVKTNSTLLSFE